MSRRMPRPEDLTPIEPFKPQPITIVGNGVSSMPCVTCNYCLDAQNKCGKYDSPLPITRIGDSICWKARY